MRIISFAWTTPALLAGAKTVTRRVWEPGYARSFRAGQQLAAYNRSQRAHGQQVATIRLAAAPTFERLADMPDSDYEAEGWAWIYAHPEQLPKTIFGKPAELEDFSRAAFDEWRRCGASMWVIRFALVGVMAA